LGGGNGCPVAAAQAIWSALRGRPRLRFRGNGVPSGPMIGVSWEAEPTAEPAAVGVILGLNEACPGCDVPGMGWPFAAAWAAAAAALAATSSLRGRPRLRFGVGVDGSPVASCTWPLG